MTINIVMKGYCLLDERGLPHGTVRAKPIGAHLLRRRAVKQIMGFDFSDEAKKHDCNGYSDILQGSESRVAVLMDNGRRECLSKVWICSRKIEL